MSSQSTTKDASRWWKITTTCKAASSLFPAAVSNRTSRRNLAHISPYLTEHINRFGEYSTHELGIQPNAYDPELDVDFAPLREQDLAAGLGQAA